MGGPRSYSFAELIRSYLQASGSRRRPLLPVWLPGLKEVRAGALLPSGPGAGIGKKTWEQFLAERLT
jgi:hypothetical protein